VTRIKEILRVDIHIFFYRSWVDNEVRELATVRLSWQHWTKALVWFDDVDISAFHSCVSCCCCCCCCWSMAVPFWV